MKLSDLAEPNGSMWGLRPADRMEAEKCRVDVVIHLAKIEVEGPRIVHDTLRRFYDRP